MRVVLRITAAAAIARADVEKSVGTKAQLPAVVILEGLIDRQQLNFTARIRLIAARTVLRDHRIARGVGVVHVEPLRLGERGWERQTQQPTLTAGLSDTATQVQKWLRQDGTVAKNLDETALLNDKQASGAVARMLNVRRSAEPLRNLRQANFLGGQRGGNSKS